MFRKKRACWLGLFTLLLFLSLPAAYGAAGSKPLEATVYRYQGDLGGWQSFGPLKTEKGRTLVPLRKYAEMLGFTVYYNVKTQETAVESVKTQLVLKPGTSAAWVDGKKQNMPAPLRYFSGSAWISLDYIAKVFPAKITQSKYGVTVHVQESYVRKQISGEWLILHDQTGDVYLSTKAKPAPVKIASLDLRVNLPKISAEKTENGNYYVSVEEFEGDGAIFSHDTYNSLYIRGNKEALQYTTINYEHNYLHRYKGQIVFVKENEVLFIDDKTGKTLDTVPFAGSGLVDIQDDVWVTRYDGYSLYFPETGKRMDAYELVADEKDRQAVAGQIGCPVSPRCGTAMGYEGREGHKLVFTYKDQRVAYDLKS